MLLQGGQMSGYQLAPQLPPGGGYMGFGGPGSMSHMGGADMSVASVGGAGVPPTSVQQQMGSSFDASWSASGLPAGAPMGMPGGAYVCAHSDGRSARVHASLLRTFTSTTATAFT
jgi:hypothetical protein